MQDLGLTANTHRLPFSAHFTLANELAATHNTGTAVVFMLQYVEFATLM